MAASRRPLTVEPFEDRFLPSVTFLPADSWYAPSARTAASSDAPARSAESAQANVVVWTGYVYAGQGVWYRIRVEFVPWTADRTPAQPEPRGGTARPPADDAGATAKDPPADTAAETRGATGQARGPRGQADGTAQAVAALAPADAGDSDGGFRAPARPAATQPVQPVQAPLGVSGAVSVASALGGYIYIEGVAGGFGSPAQPPAPAPTEAEPPATSPEAAPAAQAVEVPAAAPTTGHLPLDLSAVAASAGHFLNKVSDLSAEWPDDMPGFEDYLWTAAAVLLAGGATYAASTRRTTRPPRGLVGLDSTLAEWEGGNARRPG